MGSTSATAKAADHVAATMLTEAALRPLMLAEYEFGREVGWVKWEVGGCEVVATCILFYRSGGVNGQNVSSGGQARLKESLPLPKAGGGGVASGGKEQTKKNLEREWID